MVTCVKLVRVGGRIRANARVDGILRKKTFIGVDEGTQLEIDELWMNYRGETYHRAEANE